jgi:hypothetical protein
VDLTAAQTELQARGFDYLSSSRLTIMLNAGKNALEDEYAWPWLETTTTGTAPLTISDLKDVLYCVDTSNRNQLTGLDARDVADWDAIVTTAGTPESWWLDGATTLKVYPTSTSVQLSVRYVKFSPELSAGTDTPLIPVRYHSLWVDYAVIQAYLDSDNYDAARALLGYIREFRIPQMIEAYATRNRQNPGYAVVSWASDDW